MQDSYCLQITASCVCCSGISSYEGFFLNDLCSEVFNFNNQTMKIINGLKFEYLFHQNQYLGHEESQLLRKK